MMETLEMIFQHILIIQIIIHVSNTKSPDSICDIKKPFERSDQSCGDFNDICVKKDDLMCNNFQAACQQCPPTNYTVSVLLHLKNQIDLSNQRTATLKGQTDKSQKKIQKLTDLLTGFVVIFILGSMIIMVLIFIVKYGSIVSYFKFRRKKKIGHDDDQGLHDPLLDSSKESESNYKNFEMLVQAINKLVNQKDFEMLVQAINKLVNQKEYSALESEYSALKSAITYKLRFQIGNQFDETELFVSKFDNVIKLKKSICDGNMNMNDYKRMIMKYKGVTLDNNQFLLSCIDSTNIYPIICEFDDNVDVDAMIVIKLKCDNIYPEMLQIWKYQTIKQLKIIISKMNKTNHEDLLISYKSNQLDDDKSIDYYKIEDYDWINVLNKSQEMLNISVKSMFSAKETISIEFSKFETVSSIINKSIKKIKQNMATNDFAVFLNNKLLENEKFIYEYNIDSKSLVEFCYFKSLNEIENILIIKEYGHIRLIKAKTKSFDRSILLKAYKKDYMKISHNNDLSMVLKEDLQLFQITKSHSRFIQLIDTYMDDDWIYIGMENSTKIQMRIFLSMNNEISTYEISKWANQILEGLKHLHNHNIILKDMNTMDIWIDGNHDIKLPSFNMTDYLEHLDGDDSNKYKHKDGILSYVAPEILEGKPHEASADVWSLGVVMIEIVTRGRIYPDLNEPEIVKIIKKSHTIEYDKTKKPADLIDFIDCCVNGDPKERSTIDQLMKHKFIDT